MAKKHPNGYWVQQLTDKHIHELLLILSSTNPLKKFNRVLNQTRTNDSIKINYCSVRTDRYFTHYENNLLITDYEVDRKHSHLRFYDYMIGLFGESYAKDLLTFADEYISENPEGYYTTQLKKLKTTIPSMIKKNKLNNTL